MQFQYGCSVAPPTFVVLKLNTFVYKSLKCIAKTYVLAVIADVNLFVILQRLGEVFHKYVRSSIKILWQAARVENTTVTSQQGTSTLTHNSLVIDGISVPHSFLEMQWCYKNLHVTVFLQYDSPLRTVKIYSFDQCWLM